MTDEAPDVPFNLSFADLPVIVPDPVGPFRVVLLAVTTGDDDAWRLHYAATGESEGGVCIDAEDDQGNRCDVRSAGDSRGDDGPIVGWWSVTPRLQSRRLLRLVFSFAESTPADAWNEDVESKRARAGARIEIHQGLLIAASNHQLVAGLMHASADRTTAIARLMGSPLALSERQAHHVADLSLGRLTRDSRRLLEEELLARQAELRQLGD